MPYDVCGWVEARWRHKNEHGSDSWCALLNLSFFLLSGDTISSEMFGLAKVPSDQPHFEDRGIPPDASSIVVKEFERNKSFVEKHGEGALGHTYALYSELKPLLLNMDEDQSNWAPVFAILETLTDQGFEADSLRVVVWANW